MKHGDSEALGAIAAGRALPAAVENDLEERGLIVQTDEPYATLTRAGRELLTRERVTLGPRGASALLPGAKVVGAEFAGDYVCIRFDNGATLYADSPNVYVDREVAP
jgi:hypothetical protein